MAATVRLHRVLVALAALTAASTALVACGSGGGSSGSGGQSTIVIGNEADLTGNATVGVPGNYGVKLAVQQINAHGGIDGHQLELKTEDSAGSAAGGAAAVRRLVEADGAQAIVATASSDAMVPAVPAAQSRSVPFVVSAGSDPVLVAPANTFVFMSPAVPVNIDVQEYLKFLAAHHFTNVALVATTAAFASAAVQDFKSGASAAGVRLATVQTFGATDTDFSAQVKAVQDSNVDAMFVIGDFTGNVLKAALNAGVKLPTLYDASATDPLLIKSIGAGSEGLISFQTQAKQLLDADTGAMATWKADFTKAFPKPPAGVPSQFSLQGYQTTFIVAEAIKKALAKGGDVTGSSIRDAMQTISGFQLGVTDFPYAAPIGYPVTFSARNHAGNATVTPVQVKNGVFVPIPESAGGQ
jgi:branched-chain amino acid transport system substrate-binding protein